MDEPFIKFYVADHLSDMALRRCGAAARGVWADMTCLMHQGVPYGHLATAAGSVERELTPDDQSVGEDRSTAALDELESHKVFSRNAKGVIFSRRMVREAATPKGKSPAAMPATPNGATAASSASTKPKATWTWSAGRAAMNTNKFWRWRRSPRSPAHEAQ